MLPNAFIGKTTQPTDAELAATLGPSQPLWNKLVADLADEQDLTEHEWNSFSPKLGWSYRIKRKKRNIIYLIPCDKCFRIALVFGDKAVRAACESNLPERIIELIKSSRKYAEGTAIDIEVKGPRELSSIKKLTAIKLAN